MKELIIYHGSNKTIKKPKYHVGNKHNDFGYGFYCTQDVELAKEWSVKDKNIGFVNKYKIQTDKLKILDLTSKKYSTLNWISILLKNRTFSVMGQLPLTIRDFLIKNYYVDISKYDLVIGYRADDSYFAFAYGFINNTLSLDRLDEVIKYGNLGKQVVIVSKKAFNNLQFIESKKINSEFYYIKRLTRDCLARMKYKKISKNKIDDINSTYALDIVRKKGEKHEGK